MKSSKRENESDLREKAGRGGFGFNTSYFFPVSGNGSSDRGKPPEKGAGIYKLREGRGFVRGSKVGRKKIPKKKRVVPPPTWEMTIASIE